MHVRTANSQAKLGEVLARAGDLMGAQTQFEESLATAREVARLWPARSPDGIRTVRTVLLSLGKVLTARGEFADALERLEDSLALAQQIATRSPSAVAQRDVIENHVALARLRGGEAHWAEALTLAEALKASGDLSDAELEEIRSHVRKR
jgi:tetratricopeptide (TPR) repeat protein